MAKKKRIFTNQQPITKADAEQIANKVMATPTDENKETSSKKTEPQPKKETTTTPKGRNQKVLYVSPTHHQTAKKNAYLKGYSQLREYIEYLIDQDNNV